MAHIAGFANSAHLYGNNYNLFKSLLKACRWAYKSKSSNRQIKANPVCAFHQMRANIG
jgi:hypothetical protein